MLSSEDLFEFIKESTTQRIEELDGEKGFMPAPLAGADLAAAIEHLGRVIEVESRYDLERRGLEAMALRSGGGIPSGGPLGQDGGGHGNYN